MRGFCKEHYSLEGVSLAWPSGDQLATVSASLAPLDPWKRLEISATSLQNGFVRSCQAKHAWIIFSQDQVAGIVTIKPDWLLGPYLNLIGLLPDAQGKGIGLQVLEWMQGEAQKSAARNMYLCVSDFNERAHAFYSAFGFEKVGELEALIKPGYSEILMRKRLF